MVVISEYIPRNIKNITERIEKRRKHLEEIQRRERLKTVEVESDKFNVNDEYYGLTADIINDQQNEDTTRLLTPVIIPIKETPYHQSFQDFVDGTKRQFTEIGEIERRLRNVHLMLQDITTFKKPNRVTADDLNASGVLNVDLSEIATPRNINSKRIPSQIIPHSHFSPCSRHKSRAPHNSPYGSSVDLVKHGRDSSYHNMYTPTPVPKPIPKSSVKKNSQKRNNMKHSSTLKISSSPGQIDLQMNNTGTDGKVRMNEGKKSTIVIAKSVPTGDRKVVTKKKNLIQRKNKTASTFNNDKILGKKRVRTYSKSKFMDPSTIDLNDPHQITMTKADNQRIKFHQTDTGVRFKKY